MVTSSHCFRVQSLSNSAELAGLCSSIGSHRLLFGLLKLAALKHGMVSSKVARFGRRYLMRDRPLFVLHGSDGSKLVGDVRDEYSLTLKLFPHFDDPLLDCIKRFANDVDGDILDIGANMGVVAIAIATAFPARHVMAFEPVPDTAKRAAAGAAVNGITNLTVIPAAVGRESGTTKILFAVGRSQLSSLGANRMIEHSKQQSIDVPLIALGDSLEQFSRPVGVIKIDVEGFELSVLEGAVPLVRRDAPVIIFEYNTTVLSDSSWRLEDALKVISQCGDYSFRLLDDAGTLQELPKEELTGLNNIVCIPRRIVGGHVG